MNLPRDLPSLRSNLTLGIWTPNLPSMISKKKSITDASWAQSLSPMPSLSIKANLNKSKNPKWNPLLLWKGFNFSNLKKTTNGTFLLKQDLFQTNSSEMKQISNKIMLSLTRTKRTNKPTQKIQPHLLNPRQKLFPNKDKIKKSSQKTNCTYKKCFKSQVFRVNLINFFKKIKSKK